MPKSYEEATEENAALDDGDPEPEDEYGPDISTKSVEEAFAEVEKRVEAVPEFLRPESDERTVRRPPTGGRRQRSQIDIDLGNIQELDNTGLLEVIARVSIAQLSALLDIADAVEPFKSITVSGVNSITNPDVAEPVVPESDDESIPTRSLFMKASEDNDDRLYIGDDQVQPNSGYILTKGEFIVLEIDLRGEELYMASETAGQTIELLGVV